MCRQNEEDKPLRMLYQPAYDLTHFIQSRLAMDLIVFGMAMRPFQASQQASTMAS